MDGKHFTELPEQPGTYCVGWNGWRTFAAVYMVFDGKEWVDLVEMRKHYFMKASKDADPEPGEFYWYPNRPR